MYFICEDFVLLWNLVSRIIFRTSFLSPTHILSYTSTSKCKFTLIVRSIHLFSIGLMSFSIKTCFFPELLIVYDLHNLFRWFRGYACIYIKTLFSDAETGSKKRWSVYDSTVVWKTIVHNWHMSDIHDSLVGVLV